MPNIFKALASITAWVLFVSGLIGLIWNLVWSFWEVNPLVTAAYFAVWVATLVLAVVVMRLRQKME